MRIGRIGNVTVVVVVFALSSGQSAIGVSIGAGSFGPDAVAESFEALSPGSNIPVVGNGAFLRPGESTTYTFPSGASLTSPIPNPAGYGVRVGDFALGDASARLLWESVRSVSDVPFGSAYLITGDESSSGNGVEFSFPGDMLRVGAYVGGSYDWCTLTAYDATGVLIESMSGSSPWKTNFLAVEDQRGIRRVTITGLAITLVVGPRNILVDDLMFEPLPEPSGVILLLASVLALLARRRIMPLKR